MYEIHEAGIFTSTELILREVGFSPNHFSARNIIGWVTPHALSCPNKVRYTTSFEFTMTLHKEVYQIHKIEFFHAFLIDSMENAKIHKVGAFAQPEAGYAFGRKSLLASSYSTAELRKLLSSSRFMNKIQISKVERG
jgi:hypothetical protein